MNENLLWLRIFEEKHGRPLRVLHVGNVANNAYLNAKFLRQIGIEADVLCAEYFHVMGCPEWEDIELAHGHGSDFDPVFNWADRGKWVRPDWFFQGSLPLCAALVEARWGHLSPPKRFALKILKKLISNRPRSVVVRALLPFVASPTAVLLRGLSWTKLAACAAARLAQKKATKYPFPFNIHFKSIFFVASSVVWALNKIGLIATRSKLKLDEGHTLSDVAEELETAFAGFFPSRKDRLTKEEVLPYLTTASLFKTIFSHYDLVQLYGSEPYRACLTGNTPYVAFEHGTLRDFTLGDNPYHRLIALGYRAAAHTFVTNGDCLEYAQKLDLQNYSAMIHPIDVAQHRMPIKGAIEAREHYNADILMLCPLRHDWNVKGTDVHLRAIPLIKAAYPGKRVVLLTASWGNQVEDSRNLLEDLGCANDVVWLPPLSRIPFIRLMRICDVVLDQIALPHFGATAPQALAAGTPVISSYVPTSTAWIVDEPAPILPAFNPEEVAVAVTTALDPEWRKGFAERAQYWTDRYHSVTRVQSEHLRIYKRILENEPG